MDLRVTRWEQDAGVGLLTLDRPDRLNAWTTRMEHEVRWLLDRADRDASVRVIVVTGAGRGFCAGADARALDKIVEAGAYEVAEADEPAHPGAGVRADFEHRFSFLLGLAKPVVAAINGAAAGVGLALACFADVRVAAAGAKLTTSFARLGLPAEDGLSWILPRLVGAGRAADLLFSSRVILAEEAAEIGLVNRVVPADELLPEALGYARRLASEVSPASLRTIKRQLWADVLGDLHTAAKVAEEALHRMVTEPDFAEGAAAMAEKRPPRF